MHFNWCAEIQSWVCFGLWNAFPTPPFPSAEPDSEPSDAALGFRDARPELVALCASAINGRGRLTSVTVAANGSTTDPAENMSSWGLWDKAEWLHTWIPTNHSKDDVRHLQNSKPSLELWKDPDEKIAVHSFMHGSSSCYWVHHHHWDPALHPPMDIDDNATILTCKRQEWIRNRGFNLNNVTFKWGTCH